MEIFFFDSYNVFHGKRQGATHCCVGDTEVGRDRFRLSVLCTAPTWTFCFNYMLNMQHQQSPSCLYVDGINGLGLPFSKGVTTSRIHAVNLGTALFQP